MEGRERTINSCPVPSILANTRPFAPLPPPLLTFSTPWPTFSHFLSSPSRWIIALASKCVSSSSSPSPFSSSEGSEGIVGAGASSASGSVAAVAAAGAGAATGAAEEGAEDEAPASPNPNDDEETDRLGAPPKAKFGVPDERRLKDGGGAADVELEPNEKGDAGAGADAAAGVALDEGDEKLKRPPFDFGASAGMVAAGGVERTEARNAPAEDLVAGVLSPSLVVAADLVPNEKGDEDGAVDKLGAAGVNPNAGGLEGAPLSVFFFSSPLGFADPNANPPPAPAPPLDGKPPKGEVDAPAAFSPPATSIFFPPNEKPPALSKRGLGGGG